MNARVFAVSLLIADPVVEADCDAQIGKTVILAEAPPSRSSMARPTWTEL